MVSIWQSHNHSFDGAALEINRRVKKEIPEDTQYEQFVPAVKRIIREVEKVFPTDNVVVVKAENHTTGIRYFQLKDRKFNRPFLIYKDFGDTDEEL